MVMRLDEDFVRECASGGYEPTKALFLEVAEELLAWKKGYSREALARDILLKLMECADRRYSDEAFAKNAVDLADALLAELAKQPNGDEGLRAIAEAIWVEIDAGGDIGKELFDRLSNALGRYKPKEG